MKNIELLIYLLIIGFTLNVEAGNPMAPPMMKEKPLADTKARYINTDTDRKPEIKKEFILAQIIYSKDRKVAVINNRILVEGNTINNAKVVRINRRSVQLKRKSQKIVLRLSQVKVKIKEVKNDV